MAVSSFTWNQIAELARNLGAKKVQVGTSDVLIAQFVAGRMYTYHPWQFSLVQSIDNIPFVDGQQDYPSPPDIYRLTQAWIHVTQPGSVDQFINLDVVANLTPDLNPTGVYGTGGLMYMRNYQLLRLTRPIQVNAGQAPQFLNIEYQPQPAKITDMGMPLPFPDEYAQIAVEGYMYWLYKFGDDERAGTTVKQGNAIEYTGQLGVFEAQLMQMAGAENAGEVQTIFPSDTLGANNQSTNTNPFWFGF